MWHVAIALFTLFFLMFYRKIFNFGATFLLMAASN